MGLARSRSRRPSHQAAARRRRLPAAMLLTTLHLGPEAKLDFDRVGAEMDQLRPTPAKHRVAMAAGGADMPRA